MTAQFCGQSQLTNPNQKIKVNPTNHSVPKIPYSDFIPKKIRKVRISKKFRNLGFLSLIFRKMLGQKMSKFRFLKLVFNAYVEIW